jgi:hypothetical protein
MELLKWTLYYLTLVSLSVVISVIGWKLGAKLKYVRRTARHNKDLKVIQDFERSDDI